MPETARPVSRSPTILLVDDDDAVRRLTREILRLYRYRVLDAGGGAEALELSRRHRGTIGLLLTDVEMPEMPGRELALRLEALRPGMRTLFLSGYSSQDLVSGRLVPAGAAVLHKPFTMVDLIRRVSEVLAPPVECRIGAPAW